MMGFRRVDFLVGIVVVVIVSAGDSFLGLGFLVEAVAECDAHFRSIGKERGVG